MSDGSTIQQGTRGSGRSSPALEAARLRRYHQALVRLAGEREALFGDLEGALRQITDVAARTLGVERVGIWKLSGDRSRLIAVTLYELSGDRHSPGAEIPIGDAPGYLELLDSGKTLAIEDAEADLRTRPFSERYLSPLGITSTLDVPIRVCGEVVAVVRHEHVGAPRQWMDEEQEFATSAGAFAAVAYESHARTRSEREARAGIEQYAVACEIARLALSGAGLRDLQKAAAEKVATVLRVPFSQISDFESDGPALRLRAGVGWRTGSIGVSRIETETGSFFDCVSAAGGCLVVEDHASDERFRPPDLLANHGVVSGVTVLIGDSRRPAGLLGVYVRSRREFASEEIRFLEEVARTLTLVAAGSARPDEKSSEDRPRRSTEGGAAERLLSRMRQVVQKTKAQVAAPPRRRSLPPADPRRRSGAEAQPAPQSASVQPREATVPPPSPTPRPSTPTPAPPPSTPAASPQPEATRPPEEPRPASAPREAPPAPAPPPTRAPGVRRQAPTAPPAARAPISSPAPQPQEPQETVLDLEEMAPEEETPAHPTEPIRARRRILIAEQTFETQRIMRSALERAGYDVVTEAEGQAGAEAALIALRHGQSFDLILADIHLPVLDGFGMVRRLREGGYTGPIVAIVPGPTERSRCLSAGFDECTQKPVESARLVACVTRQLDRKGSQGLG